MDLLAEIKEETNTAIILITHDLGVVAGIAKHICVMYSGKIVERGTSAELFYHPRHPYTWALLSSLPQLGVKGEPLYSIAGTPFLDAQCDMEKGIGLIIYGHNMNDGSMFADIAGYTQETYWREHPIIQCDSLTRQREYEVMAVLQFKDSEQAAQDYYSVPCDEMNFTEYISRLADAALYDTGIQAVWGDQILALSTCSRQDSDSRILVIARKTGL